MTERTSLPACAKNHPGTPSVIKVTIVTFANGTTFERAHCTVCGQINARTVAHKLEAGAVRRSSSNLECYGVVRLNWTPPEMLRTDETVAGVVP